MIDILILEIRNFSVVLFVQEFEKVGKGIAKFETQAESKDLMTKENPETILFQTCYVQNNEPEIGFDTLEVLLSLIHI